MPHYLRLLIVVADGEHARFVRAKQDNALYTDAAFDSAAAHKRSSDLGSDHPGASFHTGSTVRNSIAPEHDLHDQEKEKFAHYVAKEINEAAIAGTFGTVAGRFTADYTHETTTPAFVGVVYKSTKSKSTKI